jgi:glutamate-1-semialdehyde 2,1-aminomutase
MALGRFFRRQSPSTQSAEPEPTGDGGAAEPESQAPDEEREPLYDDAVEPEAQADVETIERSWRERARDAIPGGASTGSKRPVALYGEGNTEGPTHYARATGCHLITPGDTRLLDCTMALGSVALGYDDEAVTRAVVLAAAAGNVAGLAHTSEVEIAERLADVIPCAEQVRFLKSGADAVSAAIRIARAATSRAHVVGSGYFGWHDWANEGKGIPHGARADFTSVPFDDVASLERACSDAGQNLAAVILEPVVERLPSEEWIGAARRICDDRGAVLIFDEMKTGFRLRRGGYQEFASVRPDLATFGKAMANGYPIAAVVGLASIMEAAGATWISSTLAGEATALAAVGAVLDRYESLDVCASLWAVGAQMRESLSSAVRASGVDGVEVLGIDPMWLLRFADPAEERRFLELAVREGALFKRGAYNYPALAHDEEEILVEVERVASSAFVSLLEESRA